MSMAASSEQETPVPNSGPGHGPGGDSVAVATTTSDPDTKSDEKTGRVDGEASVDGDDGTITEDTTTATTPPPNPTSPPPVPDGGWAAWMQVASSFVVMMDTWGLINSFGVFQTYYETELLPAQDSSAISWIGSLQGALLLLLGMVSGPLFDAGYFRSLLASGTFLVVFGMFMTSLCTEYWQVLLAQGFCVGIGAGLLFLPSAAVLSQYFSRRRAVALGLQSVGSPLAGAVFPIVFSRLQPAVGFPWATRALAFILLGLSAIPLAFLKTRLPPPTRKRAFIDFPALRDLPYMVYNSGSFLAYLGLYVPYFYIQLWAIRHGLTKEGQGSGGGGGAGADFSSAYLITLLNAGSVPGRVLPNLLADYLAGSSVAVMAATALGASVLAFGWLGISSFGGIVTFTLLFGFFNGGVTSLPPSAIAALTPDLSRIGTRMGMTFIFTGTAVLIGTPVAGAVLRNDHSEGSWRGLVVYCAVTLLGGAALVAAAHVLHVRKLRDKAAGTKTG